MRLIFGFLVFAIILAIISRPKPLIPNTSVPSTAISSPSPGLSPLPTLRLFPPVADFKNRITKKSFGTYVHPQNSPVSPERFTGYHTALDIEFGDVPGDVPVHAITSGTVVYSGWVSGYGGLLIVSHSIDGRQYNVVYGHLRTAGLLPVTTPVTPNQVIGYLGDACSRDTDNERKHLHFGVPLGDKLEFLGYVQNESDLARWLNPALWY